MADGTVCHKISLVGKSATALPTGGRRATSVESYAHRSAKATLVSWLRDGAVRDDYKNAAGLSWRVNRDEPWFGVWEEYPVTSANETSFVWDENGWWSDFVKEDARRFVDRQPIPTYAELIERGTPPRLILDVAIQHKGCICAGIEIVHKHGLTDAKRALLLDLGLPVYVVMADWILSQVGMPDRLVVVDAINHNHHANRIEMMAYRRRARVSRRPI